VGPGTDPQALLTADERPRAWSWTGPRPTQNKVTLLRSGHGLRQQLPHTRSQQFASGICGFGNFARQTTEIRTAASTPSIAAIKYFGASTWDSHDPRLDDATVHRAAQCRGPTKRAAASARWAPARRGDRQATFLYQGPPPVDMMADLEHDRRQHVRQDGRKSTVSPAHIADNTTSPEEGQCCMGHEVFTRRTHQGLRVPRCTSLEL